MIQPNLEYKGRLLVKNGDQKLLYKRGKLFIVTDHSRVEINLYNFCGVLFGLGMRIRLIERLLRLEPRCACCIEDGYLLSWQGKAMRIQKDGAVTIDHIYRSGMNNPISFAMIKNMPGFEDGILYGEYWGNLDKTSVAIWRRNKAGQWSKVYEYPANTIQHIHGIVPDPANQRVLVLTGDTDAESGIWETKDDFKTVIKLLGGSQKYRSCVAFPSEKGIIYATDTPLTQNYVYYLKNGETEPAELFKLQGTCVYGTTFVNRNGRNGYVFITAVEPDASIHGLRYYVTYKLGRGITNRYSYINILPSEGKPYVAYKAKKDILPIWLFQFGNFKVSETNTGFCVTGQSLKHIDERTLEFNL